MRKIKDVVSIAYLERGDGLSISNTRADVVGEYRYVVLSYMNNGISTLAKDLKDDGFLIRDPAVFGGQLVIPLSLIHI